MNVRSLVLLATLLTPVSLLASPATYTYTSSDYTVAYGGFTTSEFITGSVTLSAPLGDNLSAATLTPTSFTFSDGLETLTNSNNAGYSLAFSTDASGNITAWQFTIYDGDSSGDGGIYLSSNFNGSFYDQVFYNNYASSAGTFAPGTWTPPTAQVSATPEPSSLILLGTGLAGTLAAARRRFRR